MINKIVLFFSFFLILSCSLIVDRPFERYSQRGLDHARLENYETSLTHYRAAYKFAMHHPNTLGDFSQSRARYNYALALARTCIFNDAETLLLQAIEIDKKILKEDPSYPYSTIRYFELARLYLDQQKFQKAADSYSQIFSLADNKQNKPSNYSNVYINEMRKYAYALKKSGNEKKAKLIYDKTNEYIAQNNIHPIKETISHHAEACSDVSGRKNNWKKVIKILLPFLELNMTAGLLENKERISKTRYELARAYGATCQYKEAENEFKIVLTLDTFPIYLMQTNIELATMYYKWQKYSTSLPYFKAGFKIANENNILKSDPFGMEVVYKKYIDALIKSGKSSEADALMPKFNSIVLQNQEKIAEIKRKNPNANLTYDSVIHGSQCDNSKS